MCDELQGEYPKDFKFLGWHPFCRCHTTTILKDKKDIMAEAREDYMAVRNDKPLPDHEPKPMDLPENMTAWIERNRKRITGARKNGTLAPWLAENKWVWDKRNKRPSQKGKPRKPAREEVVVKTLTPEEERELRRQRNLDIAKKRHDARTQEQVKAIQDAWRKDRDAIAKEKRRKEILENARKRHEARTEEQRRTIVDARRKELDTIAREERRKRILENAKKRHEARTKRKINSIKKRWADDRERVSKEIRRRKILEDARKRHEARTPEQIKAIRDAWRKDRDATSKGKHRKEILENAKKRHDARTKGMINRIRLNWSIHETKLRKRITEAEEVMKITQILGLDAGELKEMHSKGFIDAMNEESMRLREKIEEAMKIELGNDKALYLSAKDKHIDASELMKLARMNSAFATAENIISMRNEEKRIRDLIKKHDEALNRASIPTQSKDIILKRAGYMIKWAKDTGHDCSELERVISKGDLSEILKETKKVSSDVRYIHKQAMDQFDAMIDDLKRNGVRYKKVEDLKSELNDEEIIDKLGGRTRREGLAHLLGLRMLGTGAEWT